MTISELHIDRAYVNAPVVDEVLRARGRVLAKPWGVRAGSNLFTKRDFKIDLRAKTITCPAGEVESFEPGSTVEFDPEACGACPQRAKCTSATSGRGRSVSIAEDEALQKRFRRLPANGSGTTDPPRAGPSRTRARAHRRAKGGYRSLPRCPKESLLPAARRRHPESRSRPTHARGVTTEHYGDFNLFGAPGSRNGRPTTSEDAREADGRFPPEELARHVEAARGVPARFVEAVPVKGIHQGQTVWEGNVKVFTLTGHPSGATKAYAWTYPTEGGKRRFVAILGVSPVDDAAIAVRTMILAQVREAERANRAKD